MYMKKKIHKIADTIMQQRKFIKKTFLVLIGVLALQLGLAASYLYAFHSPEAREIPIAIIQQSGVDASVLASSLKEKSNGAFDVSVVASKDDAILRLKDHKIYGAYTPSLPRGEIIVATASDKKLTDISFKTLSDLDVSYQKLARQKAAASVDPLILAFAKSSIESPTLSDIKPLSSNDPNGTGLFYIAFSFVFGGYLAAVALNIISVGRNFTHRNAIIRSVAFLIYGLFGGLLISTMAVYGIEILPKDSFWAVVGIGTLTTAGVGLFASSLISLLGTLGTGIVIVLFVILGTPASGGPLPLLLAGQGPWQWLSNYLPTGQAMESIRQIAYFDGVNLWSHLWLLVSYAVVGFILLTGLGLHRRSFDVIEDSNKD